MTTVTWLRRRRCARRFNPERECSEHRALQAAERYLAALTWYRHRLDYPGRRYERR